MAVTTSRIPAVIDYLVSACTVAATLGAATPPVSVIDGPMVTADPGPLALWIGVDDIDPGTTQPAAASGTQDWAGLGRMARNERLTIHCVAQAWSGNDDVRSLRVAAAGIVSAVEDLVRGDVSLGGTVSTPGNAGVTSAEWRQGPGLVSTRGMAVRVMFEITAQARIGG